MVFGVQWSLESSLVPTFLSNEIKNLKSDDIWRYSKVVLFTKKTDMARLDISRPPGSGVVSGGFWPVLGFGRVGEGLWNTRVIPQWFHNDFFVLLAGFSKNCSCQCFCQLGNIGINGFFIGIFFCRWLFCKCFSNSIVMFSIECI